MHERTFTSGRNHPGDNTVEYKTYSMNSEFYDIIESFG